jgi:hypothetical protein
MKTNDNEEKEPKKAVTDKVNIIEWWALESYCWDSCMPIAVIVDDGSYGFLHVKLERAFDKTADWCWVAVAGGGRNNVSASRIRMPKSLRRHIACRAIAYAACCIRAEAEDEMKLKALPAYEAYCASAPLMDCEISSNALDGFERQLPAPNNYSLTKAKAAEVNNLRRLVRLCRRHVPKQPFEVIPQEAHGSDLLG